MVTGKIYVQSPIAKKKFDFLEMQGGRKHVIIKLTLAIFGKSFIVGRNTSLFFIPSTSYLSISAGNLSVSLYVLRDSWTSNRISELYFEDANARFIQTQAVQHKFVY